jgi:hypothetical protein
MMARRDHRVKRDLLEEHRTLLHRVAQAVYICVARDHVRREEEKELARDIPVLCIAEQFAQ